MRRVSGSGPGEDHLLEDLETEGERQLKTLLQHQLDTSASLEQCLSKRRRFAPAALYKPFGEEAAGTHSLLQFQALQESSQEMASLRELGLSEAEIHLWKNRVSAGKGSGLGAAPEAAQARIQAIQEKIAERQRILSLPQRFAGSKQLNRREMEIENSLFQGTDRHSFLRMLYYQDETGQTATCKEGPLAQLETVYQELLGQPSAEPLQPPQDEPPGPTGSVPPSGPLAAQDSVPPQQSGMITVREAVALVPEEEIVRNRLSVDEIRRMPRFSSYAPGEPSEVLYLKNLSRHVTVRDLLSLFARFQERDGPPIRFRLLSGRMRGQAFVTFPSISTAEAALQLANGFSLLGRPLVIEFGRKKTQAAGTPSEMAPGPQNPPAS
uniref:RNA-binding protein 41 n=1 Tax=Pogona vitticeps TaxID=103695 RepID=A0ABM5EVN3_9SAUR